MAWSKLIERLRLGLRIVEQGFYCFGRPEVERGQSMRDKWRIRSSEERVDVESNRPKLGPQICLAHSGTWAFYIAFLTLRFLMWEMVTLICVSVKVK